MNGTASKSRCFYSIAEESHNMRKSIRYFAAVIMVCLAPILFAGPGSAQDAKFDSETMSGLGARNIGSAAMSGRVAAIAAVKEAGRLTVYVAAASGGVWKSSNGGTTFKPVFDKEAAQSIGAVAIDPQAPKTIWRSEERRVGKERRERMSPSNDRKNRGASRAGTRQRSHARE